MLYSCRLSDRYFVRRFKQQSNQFKVVIMAEHLFDDQQQQQQQNQLQPYGVSFCTRAKARGVPYVPHLPAVIGVPHLRARQLPAQPVREQQHVMLQDQVRQDMLQHNIYQQDKIAYNRRQYSDQHSVTATQEENL